ncbi:uncharacterized protein TRIADDRAFT_57859 [Trichoplax adhaerens]|uniref:non-specific serine/threonine protein kinase n=1 Tax=Trichoplax adhaerens TaxID=10228 RepID=B3S1R6_TRIAD|nr:hypothetical protein TRIADDRAFT_57859 [Trichoplax adhaerens]EDV23341.1 hypothetical protein TRIADDRAFT_57859 [Trichoplax adhaerens]|eukprot:XP_002114251.1 hypothetical protein TRIADDRAFT_57859 [Trichoplax adhaerens]
MSMRRTRRFSEMPQLENKSASFRMDDSNLKVLSKSKLGRSAPALLTTTCNLHHHRSITRRGNRFVPKANVIGVPTAQFRSRSRSISPSSGFSPISSPRSSPRNTPGQCPLSESWTSRRWSLASFSSGYSSNAARSPVHSPVQNKLHQLPSQPTSFDLAFLSSQFGWDSEEEYPATRHRSRSLSPFRSRIDDKRILMEVYKERFPKAKEQMEEKLKIILKEMPEDDNLADGILNFLYHQLVELIRELLKTSREGTVNHDYFLELSEKLAKLLEEAHSKTDRDVTPVTDMIRKLLVIVSRPARLLECLEFDENEFYDSIDANREKDLITSLKSDVPRYVISQLGLTTIDGVAENLESKQREIYNPFKDEAPSEHDFKPIKLISRGAYGSVFLVRHRNTGQRFAMKKISKQGMLLRNQVKQVFNERDILTFVDNPFIVSMWCSFQTRKHLCMVMEYCEGGDCATLLKHIGPLPLEMAKMYFAETILGIEYIHSYGIVHRDLKPENLLITSLGHIKLTDFGLSKVGLMNLTTSAYEYAIEQDTQIFQDKQIYGTPEYIAPEVILRQGYGKPTDWWSMGIILYEFLVGCPPFYGESVEELFEQVSNGDEIEWPEEEDAVPEDAKDLITRLLQQDPATRLGTTTDSTEVKEHELFQDIDWASLLRQKVEFVPELDNEEDTSYFDPRTDRYCRTHSDEESDENYDSDTSDLSFVNFSSCSRRYHALENSNPTSRHHSLTGSNDGSTSPLLSPEISEIPEDKNDDTDKEPKNISLLLSETPENENNQPIKLNISESSVRKLRKNLEVPKNPEIYVENESDYCEEDPFTESRGFITDSPTSPLSSRGSPCTSPTSSLPPIVLYKGPRGFGFTIRSIRVYIGDTNMYTVQHLVNSVDEKSTASQAGLKEGDLITHVNGEPIQGLIHPQVVALIGKGGKCISINVTQLEKTCINKCDRRRPLSFLQFVKSKDTAAKSKKSNSFWRRGSLRKSSLFKKVRGRREKHKAPQMQSSPPETSSPINSQSPSPNQSPHLRPHTFQGLMPRLRRRKSNSTSPISPLVRSDAHVEHSYESPTAPSTSKSFLSMLWPKPKLLHTEGSSSGSSPLLRRALSPPELKDKKSKRGQKKIPLEKRLSDTGDENNNTVPELNTPSDDKLPKSSLPARLRRQLDRKGSWHGTELHHLQ